MKQLVIGDIVSRAWDLAVKHWPIFVLFAFVQSILGGIGVGLDPAAYVQALNVSDPIVQAEMLREAVKVNYVLLSIGILLSIYLSFVVINLYVRAYKQGRPYTSFGEAFKVDLNQLAIFFCVDIVYALIIGVGTICCILPGIFFGVRLWYAPILAATQGASFGEAFRRSWQMTGGHFWKLLLMGITMIGISILGLCACFVGIFFAEVVIEFMFIVSLFILMPQEPQFAPEEVAAGGTYDGTANASDAYNKDATATPTDFEEVQQ